MSGKHGMLARHYLYKVNMVKSSDSKNGSVV